MLKSLMLMALLCVWSNPNLHAQQASDSVQAKTLLKANAEAAVTAQTLERDHPPDFRTPKGLLPAIYGPDSTWWFITVSGSSWLTNGSYARLRRYHSRTGAQPTITLEWEFESGGAGSWEREHHRVDFDSTTGAWIQSAEGLNNTESFYGLTTIGTRTRCTRIKRVGSLARIVVGASTTVIDMANAAPGASFAADLPVMGLLAIASNPPTGTYPMRAIRGFRGGTDLVLHSDSIGSTVSSPTLGTAYSFRRETGGSLKFSAGLSVKSLAGLLPLTRKSHDRFTAGWTDDPFFACKFSSQKEPQ